MRHPTRLFAPDAAGSPLAGAARAMTKMSIITLTSEAGRTRAS
jgi:hypothetical protein